MKINLEILREYQRDKLIDIKEHATADLLICNYTPKTQYAKFWNEITMMCRGLILDKEGNIVARPFKKFFNTSEVGTIPDGEFKAYQKYDGSLGILYWINDEPFLATRGSFYSDQALKGTELLKTYDISKLDRSKTYLFEIIYPGNRVVVDYEGVEKLVLLAIVDPETGDELPLESDVFEVAKLYDGLDMEAVKSLDNETDEGFVLRWPDGYRLKYKFAEYVRLHRLLTQCTARSIWDLMRLGKSLDELIERVPDEFYQWVKEKSKYFQSEFQRIHAYAKNRVETARREARFDNKFFNEAALSTADVELINRAHRSKIREYFIEKPEYEHICWSAFNKNKEEAREAIWDLLYPPHELPFKQET